MNKIAITLVAAFLLTSITNSFAQTAKFLKQLNTAKLERIVTKKSFYAPRIPGVYIPAGISRHALENKISVLATQAGFNFNERDTRVIARTPKLLRQFQTEIGKPIFEGRPLPYQKSLQVLNANQEKFAAARANGKYEEAWMEFIKQSKLVRAFDYRAYGYSSNTDIATDVYNFYVKHIGIEHLPRVRMEDSPQMEGVVCEFPVYEFYLIAPRQLVGKFNKLYVPAKDLVVLRLDDGTIHIQFRELLKKDYRVIK